MPTTHHLELTVTDGSAVLERVVSACRSRQCTVVSLRFEAGDRHRPGRVSMTLDGAPRMVALAAQRLSRLVDVLSVDGASAPAGRAPIEVRRLRAPAAVHA